MTDTPRTDGAQFRAAGGQLVAPLELTRELERELAAAIKRAELAETALEGAYSTIDMMAREER